MAVSLPLLFFILLSVSPFSLQQDLLPLDPAEQEALYVALEALNSTLLWRTLFPDDLCLFPPHGVVCDFFSDSSLNDSVLSPHVTELNFGPVSDFSPNPPCSPHAAFPASLSSFPRLRKLFFYRCFTQNPVPFPSFASGFGSDLQELVFVDNPALVGTLTGTLGDFTALRRLILTGSRVSGPIPAEITRLSSLEQLTLSGNDLNGEIPFTIGNIGSSLRILDLSENGFQGPIPDSIGQLKNLLKLDLSSNGFSGKIPESLKGLKNLEFLDLSSNSLGSYGVPLFLGEMRSLKELYLSGNQLGGSIPEIWENLGGILGIGLSSLGLVGNIPASMGVFLRNAVYIGLDNNILEGSLPEELGMMERAHEINLQNNRLIGRVPLSDAFIARLAGKLKLQGNPDLCVDEQVLLKRTSSSSNTPNLGGFLGKLKACNRTYISYSVPLNGGASPYSSSSSLNGGASPYSSSSSLSLAMGCYLVHVLVGFCSFCMSSPLLA